MELWLAALVIIVAMVAVGTVVARTWRPERPQHGLGPVLVARLVAVVIVTALAAAARIAVGPLAAFVVALAGVLIAIVLLIRTGYARTGPSARTLRWTATRDVRSCLEGLCSHDNARAS
jgi:hypothetical protein